MPFRLDVVTPDRVVLSEEVASLVAPGAQGYLGVLPHHAPLVTELGVGTLSYRTTSGNQAALAVSGGFMEVGRERTTVLADAAERAEEISVERARRARDQARERLQALGEHAEPAERAEARAALERATNRLRVAGTPSEGE
jgi:F-type H+-transporting ATPase subunit epsilon